MKETAQFYISHGLRVMPLFGIHEGCKCGLNCNKQCWGKVPSIRHWPDKDITLDDFTPGCNMAIILGKQLDNRWLVGLDIDGDFPLRDFLILPETLECITQNGRHLIFEVTPDSPLGNWNDLFNTRKRSRNAVDLKYCRGAMASPPSKTVDGNEYTWTSWMDPAFLPDSEVNYLIRKRKFYHPKIKRYTKWSLDPNHKKKRP